jgi:hypothetical protein
MCRRPSLEKQENLFRCSGLKLGKEIRRIVLPSQKIVSWALGFLRYSLKG